MYNISIRQKEYLEKSFGIEVNPDLNVYRFSESEEWLIIPLQWCKEAKEAVKLVKEFNGDDSWVKKARKNFIQKFSIPIK